MSAWITKFLAAVNGCNGRLDHVRPRAVEAELPKPDQTFVYDVYGHVVEKLFT